MKGKAAPTTIITLMTGIISVIFLLIPFHAFLTVWLASMVGHYTLLRLWKEGLLAILLVLSIWQLVHDKPLRTACYQSRLIQLIAAFGAVQLVWGLISYGRHDVTLKALGYGWLIDCRFLIFLVVVWLVASRSAVLAARWKALLLAPAIAVISFGLLQYFVLPYDALRHVGYNASTIFPYETINNNLRYIRVMATLRGANPLGAYLVVVIATLAVLWRSLLKQWQFAIFPLAALAVLALTFSRSAWLGAVLAITVIIASQLQTRRQWQLVAGGMTALVILVGLAALGLRHSQAFENVFTHTQTHSAVATTSNTGHRTALMSGVRDVIHEPLGRGPGTAGPASVYNAGQVRIAENYFVQLGQEVGWLGLGIFLAILIRLARTLWSRRQQPLSLALLAALVGLCFVNLLSHAWADDTLAYVFWGLLGIALAVELPTRAAVKGART